MARSGAGHELIGGIAHQQTPHGGPLKGLRVLDLTQWVAGPYCTKLLAMFGAEVIKVERPRFGDPMRYAPPYVNNRPGTDNGLAFLDLNINKRGVSLNLACETGRHIALELVRRADLVVESFRPGTLERLGLGWDVLRGVNPSVVLVSISNFGQDGPYRDLPASEIVLYAMGHEMFGTGQPDREPMSMAPRLNLCFAGQTAAVAATAAVFAQRVHGQGDWVDVSIMESFTASIDRRADSLVAFAYCGERMERLPMRVVDALSGYNRCADGFVHLSISAATWKALLRAIDEPWVHSERCSPNDGNAVVTEDFRRHWERFCCQHTKRELVERFQTAGVPCAPVNSVADLVADPQLAARAYFSELDHPVHGARARQPARAASLEASRRALAGSAWRRCGPAGPQQPPRGRTPGRRAARDAPLLRAQSSQERGATSRRVPVRRRTRRLPGPTPAALRRLRARPTRSGGPDPPPPSARRSAPGSR